MLRSGCVVALGFGALSLAGVGSVGAQQLDLPVLPGIPGEVDSEFSQLLCYDWDLGQPISFACPATAGPQAQATEGCLRVTVDALPATTVMLRGFEATFAATPTQTATYIGQGSLSHTIGETTVRMVPGSGPFTGVFDPKANAFFVEGIPIEVEGLVTIMGTGLAGMTFPLGLLDLSTFTFPPIDAFVGTLQAPTGEDAVILSGIIGSPILEPGGRLDVGSGFVVGLGGGILLNSFVDGSSCGTTPVCAADTNGDGVLTPADFNGWIIAFNSGAPECDQNGDGLCTPADFNGWILNFNAGC